MLLRGSAVESDAPATRRDIAEIRGLGIEIVIGDLVKSSIDELASVSAQYDTVIGRGGPQAIFDAQLDVRELLRAQTDTEWVALCSPALDPAPGKRKRARMERA